MDDKSYTIRVPKKWVRTAMIVVVTALIVAPLTAVAAHTFTDVPDSHTFHNDIDWLADANVTKGCNPAQGNTRFCPDDEVTRGQMAAFLKRLAENQVVDAGTLQGFEADDLTAEVFHSRSDSLINLSDGTTTTLARIDLPAGSYLITSRVDLNSNSPDTFSPAGTCVLEAGSTSNTYEIPGLAAGPGDRYPISGQIVHTFDGSGQAVFSCTPSGWSGNGVDPAITAIAVNDITTQPGILGSSGSSE